MLRYNRIQKRTLSSFLHITIMLNIIAYHSFMYKSILIARLSRNKSGLITTISYLSGSNLGIRENINLEKLSIMLRTVAIDSV
jgi:hypothetical protein